MRSVDLEQNDWLLWHNADSPRHRCTNTSTPTNKNILVSWMHGDRLRQVLNPIITLNAVQAATDRAQFETNRVYWKTSESVQHPNEQSRGSNFLNKHRADTVIQRQQTFNKAITTIIVRSRTRLPLSRCGTIRERHPLLLPDHATDETEHGRSGSCDKTKRASGARTPRSGFT